VMASSNQMSIKVTLEMHPAIFEIPEGVWVIAFFKGDYCRDCVT
jgi:hypothetical protein